MEQQQQKLNLSIDNKKGILPALLELIIAAAAYIRETHHGSSLDDSTKKRLGAVASNLESGAAKVTEAMAVVEAADLVAPAPDQETTPILDATLAAKAGEPEAVNTGEEKAKTPAKKRASDSPKK